MKLAKNAFIIALTILTLVFAVSAQTLRPDDDPRNTAPTVGTGGPVGGPTGLFTIYDGQTLRAGEFTFSAAWSNYDRDPGNVDINEAPVSFQVGVNDYVELFFNTDAYRGIKVNAPGQLSSFALPNVQVISGGRLISQPAIVFGGGAFAGQPVFRNTQFFTQFPFVGGRSNIPGFPFITAPSGGNGNTAANFPGVGSVYGSILPGIVLQTANVGTAAAPTIVPTSFTTAPSYLPDAPFISRTYGESSFSTFTVGAKFRFTGPNNPYGIGLIPFYRFYADSASGRGGGFNQLQRGASPGGGGPNPFSNNGRGDFGLVLFGDARLNKHVNVSANIGYIYNSSVKAEFANGDFTILDRPDELISGIGVDFPINRYFQPILEFRSTQYVGGRTPNAFENSPLDALGGIRFFPTRYIMLGAAYRYHINQQNADFFGDDTFTTRATVPGAGGGTFTTTFSGVPPGFRVSNDANGFIFQVSAGRRNARKKEEINKFADVTNLELGKSSVSNPCGPGERSKSGGCSDDMTSSVATTAVDPEGDVLTYNYTVSGGRIIGQGANVSWDLTGAQPGTYTITAGVDDGCGVCGKTQTRTITVAKCADCEVVCTCPTIDISGPTGETQAGGTMTFTVNVSGGSGETPTYNWSVSSGTIIEGQGTPVIRVQTTPDMAGGSVTATVDIGGLCDICDRTRSDTAGIAPAVVAPEARKVDEFNVLQNDDVKNRVDNLYIELNNNPNSQGYIINYGTDKEIAKREKQIRDAIAFRKYDASRITMVRGGDQGTGIRTVFWIVPAGAPNPEP